jgi:YgiT-type zinc finger domain-containing protein
MKCHVCGGHLAPTISDLPFSLGPNNIVVIKKLPMFECTNCTEFLIEDSVMEKVEDLLGRTDEAAELEVIAYAA